MISALRQVHIPAELVKARSARRRTALGLILIGVAWPASWLHAGPIGEFAFFPLWFGYILVADALVFRRKGSSLLSRNSFAFGGMFLASIPLWWAFEGFNHFTQNWSYLGAEEYSTLSYLLISSWSFSIVIPAVFETAELVGSFGILARFRHGPVLPVSNRLLALSMALGVVSIFAMAVWPQNAYPGAWICLLLVLDPINYRRGSPSLIAWLRRGDWRLVVALGAGALICGLFWEMWNYWAFPKWQYSVPYVGFAKVFEMPLLGYLGYLPFGLETYAAYHFLSGMSGRALKVDIHIGQIGPKVVTKVNLAHFALEEETQC
jgi:hypothetical protein